MRYMKMKQKILMFIFIFIFLVFCSGITYSIFNSTSTMSSSNEPIAKFIFNAESLDQLQLSLSDLNPGDNREYAFSVSNNKVELSSDVSVEYQMTIKTYHLIPLVINLYKMNGTNEEFILKCDETYARNSNNELVCNTPNQEMVHSSGKIDNYKLKVQFPSEYNGAEYANLVDYINIGIKSWQK